MKVHWPEKHRRVYEAEAKRRGLSLNELLIRAMWEERVPFPPALRAHLEELAAREDLTLAEFVIREMADRFELPADQQEEPGQQQFPLGA